MPQTQKEWIKILIAEGWAHETGRNHQVKMTKDGERPITLPDNHRRPYGKGFEAALRRQAGLK